MSKEQYNVINKQDVIIRKLINELLTKELNKINEKFEEQNSKIEQLTKENKELFEKIGELRLKNYLL